METKFNLQELDVKFTPKLHDDCDLCCFQRTSLEVCEGCPLRTGFYFKKREESPQVSSFKNRSDSSHKVVEVRVFISCVN